MAGAVSAGAYTAGVLDFLVEALDEWYRLRAQDPTLPQHDVRLEALTGASAGGMCAAISAVALKEEFGHVTAFGPRDNANRLYKSWVQTVDIMPLLGDEDLTADPVVHSVLDCTVIEKIARDALTANPARRLSRAWLSDKLGLIVTISNLRGIPYSVDKTGNNFEERIGYHADQVEFVVNDTGTTESKTALPLGYPNTPPDNWEALQTAAMATGAFPIALRARPVRKTKTYYQEKKWQVSNVECGADGQCTTAKTIEPAWDNAPDTFDIVCSDGGITNNNPFDCAHDLLTAAAQVDGHLPRKADEAVGAVISVAPFPGQENFDTSYDAAAESSLTNVLSALIPTLISQSRFQGENLLLTGDPNVSSRFAIAPSDSDHPDRPALLSGALGAFGGFIEAKFRDRDYHLGRRNCQQFLRVHFCLPESNALFRDNPPPGPAIAPPPGALQFTSERWYPIIPLTGSAAFEIIMPSRDSAKTTPDRVNDVAGKAAERIRRVAHALIDAPGHSHPFWSIALDALGPVLDSRLKGYFRSTIASALTACGQL